MSKSLYGTLPASALNSNYNDVVNQIYKLLPLREKEIPDLSYHISTLQFRIRGISQLFPNESKWITVLSLLEAAKTEKNFSLYRKAILDCCSMVKSMVK